MPWLRTGDTAANHPIVTSVLEHPEADDRSLNEVFGFVSRIFTRSAAHTTDYVVRRGMALDIGGSGSGRLIELALFAGYMEQIELDGRVAYRLVNEPEFMHMRTSDEIAFEAQRKADNANPALVIPVRYRDGDSCRYCRCTVNWRDRKSARGATYDHREPGVPGTVDTLVVACLACNASRGDRPDADERHPLQPEPTHPYYGEITREHFAKNAWAIANGFTLPAPDVTPQQRPGTPGTAPARPGNQPDTAPSGRRPVCRYQQIRPGRRCTGSGRAGSGRAGSGRVGSGREP